MPNLDFAEDLERLYDKENTKKHDFESAGGGQAVLPILTIPCFRSGKLVPAKAGNKLRTGWAAYKLFGLFLLIFHSHSIILRCLWGMFFRLSRVSP